MHDSLDRLPVGRAAVIIKLESRGAARRRLIDLGFGEGERVFCVSESPFGDPKAYRVRGCVIALRREDAARITVQQESAG